MESMSISQLISEYPHNRLYKILLSYLETINKDIYVFSIFLYPSLTHFIKMIYPLYLYIWIWMKLIPKLI